MRSQTLMNIDERFIRIIEEIQDYSILLLEPDGRINNWNRGAQKITGYQAEEVIGKNFKIFYNEEDKLAGIPDKLLKETIRNGKAVYEGWRIRKDGSRFWGNTIINALHDIKGNLIGFSKITTD